MIHSRYCFCVLCGLLGLALAMISLVLTPPAQCQEPGKGPVSFINDVAPILKENSCFACHDAKKRKGKLDMTTYENLRKGGENDDPIEVGKPDDSHLIQLLKTNTAKRMPPKESGEAMAKDKIAIIERWIKEGAKFDAGLDAKGDLQRELRLRWKPPAPPSAYKFPVIINAVVFTPDNQKLVAGGHQELTVWSLDGKLEKRIHTRAERAYAMAFLPDGKLVVAGGRPGQEGNVRIYDINGGMAKMEGNVAVLDGINDKGVMLKELAETDDAVLCLSVSADGKRLAAGGCDRLVRVWDISGGIEQAKLEQTCENHADWVLGIALAADGKHMLTCSRDKTAKVWDLVAKESVLTFPAHQAPVFGVAVKPDSKTGFSAGEDGKVQAWNTTGDGKALRAMAGHTKAALKIVYHPTQPLLVTCGADNLVRVWNADSGAAIKTFSGHSDQVFAVAISPDGKLVASGSYNGEIKIWKVDDPKEVKEAQSFNASPGLQPAAAPPK